MHELKKPHWLEEKTWQSLNAREKTYCGLRTNGLTENEMRERMQFRCTRTWRYFQAQIRKKIFG